jgi:hypothetical protein
MVARNYHISLHFTDKEEKAQPKLLDREFFKYLFPSFLLEIISFASTL